MDKGLRTVGLVAIVVIFAIGIGYGISLVRLDNQERVTKLVHKKQVEFPVSDINEKLKDDLAHARILLMDIEDRKHEGKHYYPSEEKELRQYVSELQDLLEKRQLTP